MPDISSGITHLARSVLTLESAHSESPATEIDHAVQACEKLRKSLTRLAGSAGYSMLLARALALAVKRDPALKPLRVEMNGSLTGVEDVRRELNGSNIARPRAPHSGGAHSGRARSGGAIVLAELLGLLVSFVGESLTLTLVREAWPNASMNPPDAAATDTSNQSLRNITTETP
jgi:hypothetical protein